LISRHERTARTACATRSGHPCPATKQSERVRLVPHLLAAACGAGAMTSLAPAAAPHSDRALGPIERVAAAFRWPRAGRSSARAAGVGRERNIGIRPADLPRGRAKPTRGRASSIKIRAVPDQVDAPRLIPSPRSSGKTARVDRVTAAQSGPLTALPVAGPTRIARGDLVSSDALRPGARARRRLLVGIAVGVCTSEECSSGTGWTAGRAPAKSTLDRPEHARCHRTIGHGPAAHANLFVILFLEAHPRPPLARPATPA
jgi:hypothetical protein